MVFSFKVYIIPRNVSVTELRVFDSSEVEIFPVICPENYIMNGECDWAIQNLESCNFDREDCVESKECLELVYFLEEMNHSEMCDKVQLPWI